MNHKLVGIHKDHIHLELWVTSFFCSCGFETHTEVEFNVHLRRVVANDMADDVLKALSDAFKKDDS